MPTLKLSPEKLRALRAALLTEKARRAQSGELKGLAARSFHEYVKMAWPIVEPGAVLVDNWHILVICEHLQAITEGRIRRLVINIPFRTLKSTLVSVLWPTWEWGPVGKPHLRYLSASHNSDLSTRDAVASRRVIESPWYQRLWGDRVQLTGDQNVKTRYENTARGYRIATSVGSGATGEGGNRILIDDPHDMQKIFSDVYRVSALNWWDNTMASRLNDQTRDAIVLIMQRGHMDDLTGHFLGRGGFEHLCLPMRYDGTRRRTVLGEYDPRTTDGELMFPGRLGPEVVADLERTLGSYGTAAQLQQNPVPLGGNIFNRAHWRYYRALPEMEELAISVDCAFKDLASSDYVAIQVWGRQGANKYLLHRIRERLGFGATVVAVRMVKAAYPKSSAILIEDKANGPAVIETLRGEIAGVLPVPPEGGKIARAYAIQPQHEAGNLWLPEDAPWVNEYLTEMTAFPAAPHDDEVDATTQVVNWMSNRVTNTGLLEYYRQQVAKMNERKQ